MNFVRMLAPTPFLLLGVALLGLPAACLTAANPAPPHLATAQAAAERSEASRPNILYILVDDQSPFDLKPYNPESQLDAPNIERLAAEGMVINNAYQMGSWVGAVCTASRHMIMSGRTVWHIPNKKGRKENPNDSDTSLVPENLVQNTLAAVFNRAGFDTMRTCKNGNSYEAANAQFTVRHDATKRGGSEESGSAWHAEQVLDYLNGREAASDSDPFLIYFGFSHPHDTRDGTPELLAKYGAINHTDKTAPPPAHPKQPPLPINYLPSHPFHHGQPGLRDEEKVSGVWDRRDEQTIRNEIGRQFACSENIDIQIGRVLAKLEQMGELDNTYIVYTSDHGMAIGRHGLQGKQNLYDHTWRVPMIVKGPGIKPGSRAKGNVYLLDTLATLCDLAGVEAPPTSEGLSFKGVLQGEQEETRDTLYGVYCGGTKPGMRCVQQGDWKLIKYDCLDGAVRETQLFNLAENPHEFLAEHQLPTVQFLSGCKPQPTQVNLAHKPEYAAKLAEMEALLLEQMRSLNDPYRFWDQPQADLSDSSNLNRAAVLVGYDAADISQTIPVSKTMTSSTSTSSSKNSNISASPRWLPGLQQNIEQIEAASHKLPQDRQKLLSGAASEIAAQLNAQGTVGLNFICTHNSRRSHLSQLWAAVAAEAYGLDGIACFSGGTEATACNERIVRSLRRGDFSVVAQEPTANNPHYWAQFAESQPPLELFSKRYDDPANPSSGFFAMMCCSDADAKCPVVLGASGRVALHYNDPKASDGTDAEDATYDLRRDEIAAEMFFLLRHIRDAR